MFPRGCTYTSLLGSNGQHICDVRLIAKETGQFEFVENTTPSFQDQDPSRYTTLLFNKITTNRTVKDL